MHLIIFLMKNFEIKFPDLLLTLEFSISYARKITKTYYMSICFVFLLVKIFSNLFTNKLWSTIILIKQSKKLAALVQQFTHLINCQQLQHYN